MKEKVIRQKFEVTITPKTEPEGEAQIAYVLGLLIGSYLSRTPATESQHAAMMEIKRRALLPTVEQRWEFKKERP